MGTRGRIYLAFGLVVAMLTAGVSSAVVIERDPEPVAGRATSTSGTASPPPPRAVGVTETTTTSVPTNVAAPVSPTPGVAAYAGLGAWVDAYDYGPAYYRPREGPLLVPGDLDAMAAHGVGTLFLQAARLDDRSPEGIVDRALVEGFLSRAHELGMRVVAWYLPKFGDLEVDLANLRLLRDFRFQGHRFDGIAVDIEWRRDVPDHAERNSRLIELSRRLRQEAADLPLGAIVYPPALLEVIKPDFWPGFPWEELSESYDVWLPMAYWTEVPAGSGHREGYRYTDEAVRDVMARLDRPAAVVHAIGGVADTSTLEDLAGFLSAAAETGVSGWSMYDYRTTSPEGWSLLQHGPS